MFVFLGVPLCDVVFTSALVYIFIYIYICVRVCVCVCVILYSHVPVSLCVGSSSARYWDMTIREKLQLRYLTALSIEEQECSFFALAKRVGFHVSLLFWCVLVHPLELSHRVLLCSSHTKLTVLTGALLLRAHRTTC
jgi:hypothetical protein